jgi:hypothetical protein
VKQVFLAEQLNSLFQIAISFKERSLAIHHACASHIAQLFDQFCCHLCHDLYPPLASAMS